VTYEVTLRRAARKQLDAVSGPEYDRLAEAVSALERNPRPSRAKKLSDSGLWRIRVRDFRVVFAIDDEKRLVIVVRVARRNEDTYRNL